MKVVIDPPYHPVKEKPYCCVPAVLQMILRRKQLDVPSQEEIGYQLGLIVPQELVSHFDRVRTGPEPVSGYGTQTSRPEFSVPRFLSRSGNRLDFSIVRVRTRAGLASELSEHLERGHDVAICYSSRTLFGDGDREHVSLIQEFDSESGEVVVVDPAIGGSRNTTLSTLFDALQSPDVGELGGLWVFSSPGLRTS